MTSNAQYATAAKGLRAMKGAGKMTTKKLEQLLKEVLREYDDGEIAECLTNLNDIVEEISNEAEELEK